VTLLFDLVTLVAVIGLVTIGITQLAVIVGLLRRVDRAYRQRDNAIRDLLTYEQNLYSRPTVDDHHYRQAPDETPPPMPDSMADTLIQNTPYNPTDNISNGGML
jgi:hypothetical protein